MVDAQIDQDQTRITDIKAVFEKIMPRLSVEIYYKLFHIMRTELLNIYNEMIFEMVEVNI